MKKYFLLMAALLLFSSAVFADGWTYNFNTPALQKYDAEMQRIMDMPTSPAPEPVYDYSGLFSAFDPAPRYSMDDYYRDYRVQQRYWWNLSGQWQHRFQLDWDRRAWEKSP